MPIPATHTSWLSLVMDSQNGSAQYAPARLQLVRPPTPERADEIKRPALREPDRDRTAHRRF